MRRNRLILLLLFVLSLVLISFRGGSVSYGFFFLTVSVPLVSLIYLLYVLFTFKIYQDLSSRTIVAGDPTSFRFILRNENLFTYSGVRVLFYSDFSSINGLSDLTEYELQRGDGISRETTLTCRYRGSYSIGIKAVKIEDYLRLFSFTYTKNPLVVNVNPRLIRLDKLSGFDVSHVSPHQSHAVSSERDFAVRDYIPGDSIRDIHWKATAALGRPMVMKHIGPEEPSVVIVSDSHRLSDDERVFLPVENKILETLLALALYFVSESVTVRSVTRQNGPVERVLEGSDSFDNFYTEISSFAFRPEEDFRMLLLDVESSPSLLNASCIYMVTGEWTPEAYALCDKLGRSGTPVMVCLITDDPPVSVGDTLPALTELKIIPPDGELKEYL
ncbi:MAG: DUF58 domain-containing protein [Lachnospiraceae bacterium]|nr:DUF58 domain-containing protein [Lachnospiraceae bacterium]